MTTMTTNTAAFAKPLNTPMTAREWTDRFAKGSLSFVADVDVAYAEVTDRAHAIAADLGVPHSDAGTYRAAVWHQEYAQNC